jgi:hypothetical protein
MIPASTMDVIPLLIPNNVVDYIEFELLSTSGQFPALAFADYSVLTSIVIPESVKMLDSFCLDKLSSLSSVQFESGSQLIEINS